MDIDDVYTRTGEFGRYQQKAFVAFCLANVFMGSQMVQNIYTGLLPNVTCNDTQFSGCSANCTENVYELDFVSFATEWDMVCSKTKVDSTQSIYMVGVMVGSFFMGGLGDKFGRFPVFFTAHCLTTIFALLGSFVYNWAFYAALRFFTGFFLSGIIIVGFVLTSESVGATKRAIVSTMGGVLFSCGISLLSLLAYLLKNWRNLSISTACIGIAMIPLFYCWLEESPRWHLGKGNIEKCKEILSKITKMNGHELGPINLKVSSSSREGGESVSMVLIFRNRRLAMLTLIQILSWFTISATYYGLTIAASKMKISVYMSVVLSAAVEIPANCIITFLMNHPRLGRVKPCVASMLVSSICCASIIFIDDEHTNIIVGLACSGKFFICMAFAIIYVQAAELFPTPVRNVGLGLVSVANRLGGVAAPQFVSLENIYHNAHYMVFGVLGCVSGSLCYLLPETVGKPLPETDDDVFSKEKKSDKEVIPLNGDTQRLLDNEEVEYNTEI